MPLDFLLGSKPKAVQEPNVQTTGGPQNQVQQLLSQILQQLLPGMVNNLQGGVSPVPSVTGGQFAAPLTSVQQNLIDQITGGAQSFTNQAQSAINPAQAALTQILSGKPQDFSQYFTQDVAAPLENTFAQRTLPALEAAFGRSAGGTNSSGQNTGFSAAAQFATQDLNDQLQRAMTSLATTGETQARQLQSAGVSQAPGLAAATLQDILAPLQAAFGAAAAPQTTQQTQLSGAVNQQNSALQFLSALFGQGGAFSVSPTIQQGNTVALPGQTGFLQSVFDAFAGGAGKSLSDPRFKVIKGRKEPNAVEVLKRLKVLDARYLWDEEGKERPMLMADNVAKVVPAAATKINEIGFIRPHELIPLLVRGVQELSRAA